MNHSPSGSLLLSKAIPGFINYKTAEGLALRTIDSHERLLNKWLEHIGDQEIGKITAQDVVAYLSWLRNEYTPRRYNGKTHPLSPKSLRNVWVTLSSFYSWAAQELGIAQIMKSVPAPRINKTPIEPLTQEEVERMLKACVNSREARTGKWRKRTAGRRSLPSLGAYSCTRFGNAYSAASRCPSHSKSQKSNECPSFCA